MNEPITIWKKDGKHNHYQDGWTTDKLPTPRNCYAEQVSLLEQAKKDDLVRWCFENLPDKDFIKWAASTAMQQKAHFSSGNWTSERGYLAGDSEPLKVVTETEFQQL